MVIARNIIFAMVCVLAVSTTALAQTSPSVNIWAESDQVIAGEDITVGLSISGGYDLAATYIEFIADTSNLDGTTANNAVVPSGYVFGNSVNNFLAMSGSTTTGPTWTISDIFDPENDGLLSSRLSAIGGGDVLASFTLTTSPDFTGEVTFGVDTSTFELLNVDGQYIQGFDDIITDLVAAGPLTVTVVPEPASLALLTIGGLALTAKRKKL